MTWHDMLHNNWIEFVSNVWNSVFFGIFETLVFIQCNCFEYIDESTYTHSDRIKSVENSSGTYVSSFWIFVCKRFLNRIRGSLLRHVIHTQTESRLFAQLLSISSSQRFIVWFSTWNKPNQNLFWKKEIEKNRNLENRKT